MYTNYLEGLGRIPYKACVKCGFQRLVTHLDANGACEGSCDKKRYPPLPQVTKNPEPPDIPDPPGATSPRKSFPPPLAVHGPAVCLVSAKEPCATCAVIRAEEMQETRLRLMLVKNGNGHSNHSNGGARE